MMTKTIKFLPSTELCWLARSADLVKKLTWFVNQQKWMLFLIWLGLLVFWHDCICGDWTRNGILLYFNRTYWHELQPGSLIGSWTLLTQMKVKVNIFLFIWQYFHDSTFYSLSLPLFFQFRFITISATNYYQSYAPPKIQSKSTPLVLCH